MSFNGRQLLLSAAFAGGVAILGSCATGPRREPPPPVATPRPPAPSPVPQAVPSTAAYFAAATALDLFQLRAADVAIGRSSGLARAFAEQAKRRHSAISAQFSFAGRRLNLLPARSLPAEYDSMLRALLSAPDFDRTYLQQQRTVLARAVRLHSAYAAKGESPTLRPVAKFAEDSARTQLNLLANG